jgi:UDPglucose 6-dehydrogenase
VKSLMAEGCRIQAYDPAAIANAREILGSDDIQYVGSAMEAAKDADALLVLTDWEEFGALDLTALRQALRYPIVIDGRNMFSPAIMAKHGFIYTSVGRADVLHDLPGAQNGVASSLKSSARVPIA